MPQLIEEQTQSANSESFTSQTEAILMRLRGALAQALCVVPGGVNKSHDIQKKLGVSFSISWQIFRVMQAEQLIDITPHIPRPRLMAKFLAALSAAGAAEQAIALVQVAYREFEEHVQAVSGDRAGFEAMTSRGSSVTDAQVEAAHRRSLFDSHRYVLGLEQDLFVSTFMAYPQPGQLICKQVMLSLRQGLRRLRANTPVRIAHGWTQRDASGPPSPLIALDSEAAEKYGINLLPEFSSKSDIRLVSQKSEDGSVITKWMGDGVGKTNAVNIAIGSLNPNAILHNEENKPLGTNTQTVIVTPTRKFIKDIILPKSAVGPVEFELTRWGYISEVPSNIGPHWGFDVPELPCSDRMFLVGDIDAGTIHELPDYTHALKRYCRVAGWNPDDLQIFRMRIDYPILQVLHRVDCTFPQMTLESRNLRGTGYAHEAVGTHIRP